MAKIKTAGNVTLTVNGTDLSAYAVQFPAQGQEFVTIDVTTFTDLVERIASTIEKGLDLTFKVWADTTAVTGSIAVLKALPGTSVTQKLTILSGTLSYQHTVLVYSLLPDTPLKGFVSLIVKCRTDTVATVGT